MYSEKDLISFGNYLLSDKRKSRITLEVGLVWNSDLANWHDERFLPQEDFTESQEGPSRDIDNNNQKPA